MRIHLWNITSVVMEWSTPCVNLWRRQIFRCLDGRWEMRCLFPSSRARRSFWMPTTITTKMTGVLSPSSFSLQTKMMWWWIMIDDALLGTNQVEEVAFEASSIVLEGRCVVLYIYLTNTKQYPFREHGFKRTITIRSTSRRRYCTLPYCTVLIRIERQDWYI